MLSIVNIDVRVKDGVSLRDAVEYYEGFGKGIELHEFSSDALGERAFNELIESISSADVIVVRITGDFSLFSKWGEVRAAIDRHGKPVLIVHVTPARSLEFRNLALLDDVNYELVLKYLTYGGIFNHRAFVAWALNHFCGDSIALPEPKRPPAQGAYRPGIESIDIDEAIDALDPSKPTIMVAFSQRKWNAGGLPAVDRLITEVENRGCNCLPLFLNFAANVDTGGIGIRGIIDNHLIRNGKTIIDSVINLIPSSITRESKLRSDDPNDPFLERLGVPMMIAPTLIKSEEDWIEDIHGLTNAEIAYDVAFPEFDGQIISIPSSTTEVDECGRRYYKPLDSRIGDLAEMAVRWASLRHKPNKDKHIAIIFYQYPPTAGHAGTAADLDTYQSMRNLLERMLEEGYFVEHVPNSSQDLVDMLMRGVTNDVEWLSDRDIVERSADMIPKKVCESWFDDLSENQKNIIRRDWGDPPGKVLTVGDEMAVPGIINGNVILSFQPTRGKEIQASYHNHNCSIPHQYLGFYRWLRDGFGVDAVIHVGTHGTLEWLPGKGVALSKDCAPDYVLGQMPNLYPYVIGNPGEGTQAKRRSYAVLVDHMIPAMVRSGTYDEVEELEGALQMFMRTRAMESKDQLDVIKTDLYAMVKRMDLLSDMGLPDDADEEAVIDVVDDLYDYVVDFKSNLIKDGLHILGKPPEGDRMLEMIYSLCRLRNGSIPSMTESVASCLGYDYRQLKESPSGIDSCSGRFNGEIIDDIEERTMTLIATMSNLGFDLGDSCSMAASLYPDNNGGLLQAVEYVCNSIHPNILRIAEEMDSLMDGMDGKYVRPGPSGCPTRGNAGILPTGRNFYSLDPEAVPFPGSWELGRRMADQMIARFKEERGCYPDSIGVVVWATDTMKTGGDDVAYLLWLMGVRPVWAGYGNRVVGLEVVSLKELGRPRVDVTVNITGLFRDTFPNLTDMINDAVAMVADLDESDEENHIHEHFRRDLVEGIESGISEDQARKEALYRVFGAEPGQYGTGVNTLVNTSNWNDRADLGNYFIDVGCHAYSRDSQGVKAEKIYRKRLSTVDVTVKNSTSREYDLFDNDDVYQYLGGLNTAVEAVRGEKAKMSVIGCSADVDCPVLRTISEESHYVFRSKVLNPKYERGLRVHGFRGATEVLKMFEYIFGWDATSDIIENWMYDRLAEHYILDESVREWIENVNPYAMREMINVLMEAHSRGMWDTTDDILNGLKDVYSECEERLEEITDNRRVR